MLYGHRPIIVRQNSLYMKKIYLLIIISTLYCGQVKAQQDPLYAQYINNPMVINPAYTGINNLLNASLSYRSQWAGFNDAPTTTALSAHSSFFENKVGGGILLVRDQLGSTVNTQFNVTYAYKIEFTEHTLSFGLQTGVLNLRDDNSELNPRDPDDEAFAGDQNISKFNFGAGLILKGDDFFLGLSVPRLVNNQEQFGTLESEVYQRHFYFSGGYIYHVGAGFALKFAGLLKSVSGSPLSMDYNAAVVLRDKYTLGVLSRNFQTYGLLAQLNISDNLRFGYVFEVPTNQSVGTSFTSHEVTLTVDFAVLDFHFLNERYF